MRLVPLPPLDDDPRDEETAEFRNALSEARITDEVYAERCPPSTRTTKSTSKKQRSGTQSERSGCAGHSEWNRMRARLR